MIEFIDKTPSNDGTPINRKNMMAVQGYERKTIIVGNGFVKEYGDSADREIFFNEDGSITDTLIGEKDITKTITFEGNIISEVLS